MKRLHRNSKKVHRGENGVFGDKNGIPHHTDPFDEVAFLADYDALTTITMENIESFSLCVPDVRNDDTNHNDSHHRRRWRLSVCPNHQNFHRFFVADIINLQMLRQANWFETFSKDDICLLEEIVPIDAAVKSDQQQSNDPDDPSNWEYKEDGLQMRLVGWEYVAQKYGNYEY